jgi:hypothetical protein
MGHPTFVIWEEPKLRSFDFAAFRYDDLIHQQDSIRPYRAGSLLGTHSQGFTLGYSHRLPLEDARHGYNTDMSDSAEVVARAFVEAINRQDVEGLAGLMTPGHRFVDSLGGVTEGREKMRAGWVGYFRMVPDFEIEVEEVYYGGKHGNAGPSTPPSPSQSSGSGSAQDDKLSVVVMLGRARGTYCPDSDSLPRSPNARDLHPTDEDLSVGTPDLGHPELKIENRWETPAAWRAVVEGVLVAEWRVYTDNEPMRERMRRAG